MTIGRQWHLERGLRSKGNGFSKARHPSWFYVALKECTFFIFKVLLGTLDFSVFNISTFGQSSLDNGLGLVFTWLSQRWLEGFPYDGSSLAATIQFKFSGQTSSLANCVMCVRGAPSSP